MTDTTLILRVMEREINSKLPRDASNKHIQPVKTIKGQSLRYWSHFINVDAQTHSPHTERDCTYTLLGVPRQEDVHKKKYCFEIHLNTTVTLAFDMTEGVSILFSGYLLTHRQQRLAGDNFFSNAAYANGQLFSNAKQSLNRAKQIEMINENVIKSV